MKRTTLVISLAAAALVSACDERPAAPGADAPATVVTPSAGPTPVPTPAPPAATDTTSGVPPPSSVNAGAAVDTSTARDAKSNDPTGTLTKEEESSGMPKAGQANNHSSPALEKGKP
jgi:hypothetical protein